MIKRLNALPHPLRQLIFQRGICGCVVCALALLALALQRSLALTFSVGSLGAAALGNAIWLFVLAENRRYVIAEGSVTEIQRTLTRKHIKEIQIATQDKPLRIRLKDRRSCLALGNTVRVYIHSRTPIYEQEGKLLLLEYLTLCTLANEEAVDAAKSA